MLFMPALMVRRPDAAASAPVLRVAGYDVLGSGTTWTTPASVEVGDLIVAGRGTTGGGVQTMGADFTAIGDSSLITAANDIAYGYRIATGAGAQVHTMDSAGRNIVYSVWRAGTFSAGTPTAGWAVGVDATALTVTWASTLTTADKIVIGGGWATQFLQPGQMPGSTLLSENSAPYNREWYMAGGWAGQTIDNDPDGTGGQRQTWWYFTVNGAA
jgi:hypothetical protein